MENRYRKGAHTVHDLKYHIVWKTKYGYGVLQGEVGLRTRQILREVCAENDLQIISGNVRSNHVHVLVSAPTDISPCRFTLFLQEASELHKFRVHAFCLMSNHLHMLLEPLQEALGPGVHRFTLRYAQYFNRQHQKRGYVFQGRFRSILVEDGCYMRRLVRYIHLNPIEAGLSLKPEDYRWSSHNAYFGRTAFTWLETERVLSHFGETLLVAISNFADFMVAKVDAANDKKEIERASRLGVFGSQEFTRAFVSTSLSKKHPLDEICSAETLLKAICERFGISVNQMSSSEKTRQVVDARATLARTAQLLSGLSLGDVGKLLGKSQSNMSRLAKRCTKSPKLQTIVDELVLSFS